MSRARKSTSTFFKVGLPMFGFVVVGSGALSVFMENHYEVKDRRHGSISERKFDLKKEHDSMVKSLDIDNYSLSRIPRPDEVEPVQGGKEVSKGKETEPLDLMRELAKDLDSVDKDSEEFKLIQQMLAAKPNPTSASARDEGR